MVHPRNSASPLSSFRLMLAILGMIALPAAITLHTAKVSPAVDETAADPSPYGYTVSLLMFLVPIVAIGFWLVPREGVRISKRSFLWTIGLLFPLGAGLDFFFARRFFTFPDPGATLGVLFPALGGGVPVEEYAFYFTGFVAVLMIYIWMDEYWLAAYGVPIEAAERTSFRRLLRFHLQSLIWAVLLIAAAIVYRRYFVETPGFPGYFVFLVVGALGPSTALLPSALPVINWRAFSLTAVMMLLVSLLWEATLGLPYGWWNFQDAEMIGIRITAWSRLPIEEIFVWISVSYATVIVYEVIRCWHASGKRARHAFLG